MDIFLLITAIVILVLLIGINIYLLAYFCHPDDEGFGAHIFCKWLCRLIGMGCKTFILNQWLLNLLARILGIYS